MKSKALLFVIVALFSVLAFPALAQDGPTEITWFVGLGTGTDTAQLEVQQNVVDAFNASQSDIHVTLNIAPSFETAWDTFATLVAAGTPPDIVGPIGVGGSHRAEWLDIGPYIEELGIDLSVFDPSLVALYETANQGYSGLPLLVYPSVTYYNRDLFDEAGLNYPPAEFGAPYVWPDGTETPWDYNTLIEVAKVLTVDASGNDATSADLDTANIVQYGLNFQWARIRLIWTDLQPENTYYDAATNTVSMPDSWREASHWLQDAIWTHHVMPNRAAAVSEALGAGSDNIFQTGKLGMAITPLWYTCCIGNSVGNFEWDIAPVPASLDGEQHVAADADTFRIPASTQNPDAAAQFLYYLATVGIEQLAPAYGGMPALPDFADSYFEAKDAAYPWGVNWQVVIDSLEHTNSGSQHHESWLPNWSQVYDREFAFQTEVEGDTGADVDVDASLDQLIIDVQSIVDQPAS
ncbi:MAG: extracellular solute-binding protein [Anaerolineae bacterium]|nr:extracellular solute-binding protein [Anaerolineae bacterium]